MIISLLRQRLFPEQIAGLLLKRSRFEDVYVCREITYNAIYAMPVGELRKELIICLRYGKWTHKSSSVGVDRRSQLPDMVRIQVRHLQIDNPLPGQS